MPGAHPAGEASLWPAQLPHCLVLAGKQTARGSGFQRCALLLELLRRPHVCASCGASITKPFALQGHGEYREILSEKDFFAEMKGTERMICHFHRENWPCKVTCNRSGTPEIQRCFVHSIWTLLAHVPKAACRSYAADYVGGEAQSSVCCHTSCARLCMTHYSCPLAGDGQAPEHPGAAAH